MLYSIIVNLRAKTLVFLTHNLALPGLRLIRKPQIFPYDSRELELFPQGSLGKDLINMIRKNDLQLLPYYAKHDIKHLILQYDTTGDGEVCLQCFMLGNGHVSFPVITTIIFGFTTMPEHWGIFINAFRRGNKSKPIEGWPWFCTFCSCLLNN